MEYNEVKEQVKQKLAVPKGFEDSENLLELGLSSLTIMRLVNQWKKQGVKVSFGALMEQPTFGEWWALLEYSIKKADQKKKKSKKESFPQKDLKEWFPLTDVQYAYWVGRDDNQPLGGIGCHAYFEFDGGKVEPERLEKAWNKLQYHHPMLRACFSEKGMQKIHDKPYSEKITINDFSDLSDEQAAEKAITVREQLSHRKLQIEKGQVAGVELTLLPGDKSRLHVDIDLLIADVQSLQILLRDLSIAYNDGKLSAESKGWNFASYLEKQETDDKEEREKAKEYWKNRLETLPKGPDLPLAKMPEEVEKTVFRRRIVRIKKEEWSKLQKRAKEYQTTPAMFLLTAYAMVLERWSRNKRFLINIPFFNRKTEYRGMEEVIADFTTLLILEVNCENNPTFIELLDRIQKQLHEDMKYTAYSGVQVQRDLAQMYGEASASAPVVFACNLGTPLVNESFRSTLGEFSYMISQTPQVWNDFQSYEDENGVQLTWDSVDELFPEDMVQDMLQSFEEFLHELAIKGWDQNYDVLPKNRKETLTNAYKTGEPENPQCLHTAFLKKAEEFPKKIALEDTGCGVSITYQSLRERAMAIAENLTAKAIQGVPVAITLPRGCEQIVAALGILLSGNFYLPVSFNQPAERRKLIHDRTGVNYVITNQEWESMIEWPEGTECLPLEEMEERLPDIKLTEVLPTDSAYIIMTSGSTGVPKGVEIAHASAWNTIEDINEKYHVSKEDKALAVSAMDFDLSVYDLFGILGAGGTLNLMPEKENRNADYWLEQVKKYHITIWNSVPVLLDMLLIRAEAMKEKLPFRVIMLSGDWIGMDLPERVATLTQTCKFVAMGGATEASIWSNYQNLTIPLPKSWKSIPYGSPLKHQAYRVVDEFGRDCPCWVEGELWIGGYGVAKGYRGDTKLTEKKFVTDNNSRWYRTGDLGRFWQDETIEFLGRKDYQVKIRGHRIELGEIEHAIRDFPGVENAVVDTFRDGHGNKSLVAYIGAELKEESGVTSWEYGKDSFGSGWERVRELISAWEILSDEESSYQEFLSYADRRSLQIMLETLKKTGILALESGEYVVDEISSEKKITTEQKNTVLRWLEALKIEGTLKEDKEKQIFTVQNVGTTEIIERAETYFRQLQPHLENMLTGKEEPLEVFYEKEPDLAPNRLLGRIPGHYETIKELAHALKELTAEHQGAPLQILEIDTRDTEITKILLSKLENVNVVYTYTDSSKYFLQEAQNNLADFDGIEFKTLNLEDSLDKQQMLLHGYDIVISVNALHRNHNSVESIKKVAELLKPNGVFLMSDLVVKTFLQDITAAFLENGFADIQDKRNDKGLVTPDCSLWKEGFLKAGMGELMEQKEKYGRGIFCGRQKEAILVYHEDALREHLLGKLPEYMVPQNYHFMKELPSLSNGKINRKQLREDFKGDAIALRLSNATTETERELLEIWKNLFGFKNLGIEDNYFTLGGDSLVATRLISEVQKTFGCKISISTIFENLTVESLSKAIERTEKKGEELPGVQPDVKNAYQAFPLTDVQYAYWMGRAGLYDLGNVATHCYFELDAEDLDIERAERALNLLIQRHGMMRVIIQPDGKQRILESVPQYQIAVIDIHGVNEKKRLKALEEKRKEMSHQIIQTEEWPLFDVQISQMTDWTQRIHISFDNIIFDGWSMFHILNEWADTYRTGKANAPIELSFRDYVMGLEQIKTTSIYEKDKKYWNDRFENFSAAPNLPVAKSEKQIIEQRFNRRSALLSPEAWNSIKTVARKAGVTPSVLLLSAYAETLRLWSSNKDFTINLTQFDRKPLHPEVNSLVGDFTTLTLLEVCERKGSTFEERIKAIQRQLTEDLEHSSYSAIEFERELKKKSTNMQGAIMPIVFTSGLGIEQWNEGKWLGKLSYNISQTPQVWLDHQVVEMDGKLCLFWDSVDELFYPGMLDGLFWTYTELLQRVAKKPELLDEKRDSLVVAPVSEARRAANETQVGMPEKTLDALFLKAAEKFPEKEAIVAADRRLSYQELKEEAFYIGEKLQKQGMKPEETVAVLMKKGWEQIVAVYGILFTGAAYLPIDPDNPKERIERILKDSNTRIILTNKDILQDKEWLNKWVCICVCGKKTNAAFKPIDNCAERLAYVIYTSGTTGMPKGVMITHRGAMNTILDINKRYQVSDRDVAFGISQLHFDLSVYDIFGVLGTGGKLVLPEPKQIKNPEYWIRLMNKEGVSIWNSVPALMEMLVEYEEYQKKLDVHALRVILLSGDWVPVTLPVRIRTIFESVTVVALGGATEASIWSNAFEIPVAIPENWISIPYGKPLANQRYYILDKNMADCPDWVPGMLYIAGRGVAKGYLNDKARTDEKFVLSEAHNERVYCTGDLGRYWSDGNIEFLGREDHQVKINGYRVELGEIETALLKIRGVIEVVAFLNKSDSKEVIRAALVEEKEYRERKSEFYREILKEKLPSYMIPVEYIKVDTIPLNANGKKDVQGIVSLAEQSKRVVPKATDEQAELSSLQNQLLTIWKEILKDKEIGIYDNFFEVGGNSLQAIQITNQMTEKTEHFIDIGGLFEHPTISEIEKYMLEETE